MGRTAWSSRKIVEDCLAINMSRLVTDRVFEKGPGYSWTYKWLDSAGNEKGSIGYWVKQDCSKGTYLELHYTVTESVSGKVTPINSIVRILTAPNHFGGKRYWFLCPFEYHGHRCGRRVSRLYCPPGSHYFGCRQCHNLTYRSQKEHDKKLDHFFDDPASIDYNLRRCDLKTAMLVMKAYQKFGRF